MALKYKSIAPLLAAAALHTAGCAQPPARSTPEAMVGVTCTGTEPDAKPEFKGKAGHIWMQFNGDNTLSVITSTFGPVKGPQKSCTLDGWQAFSCDDVIRGTSDKFTVTASSRDIDTPNETPATAAMSERQEIIRKNPQLCLSDAF